MHGLSNDGCSGDHSCDIAGYERSVVFDKNSWINGFDGRKIVYQELGFVERSCETLLPCVLKKRSFVCLVGCKGEANPCCVVVCVVCCVLGVFSSFQSRACSVSGMGSLRFFGVQRPT